MTSPTVTWWIHWLIWPLWTTTWTTKKATFKFPHIRLVVMARHLILWLSPVGLLQVINYTQKYGSYRTYNTLKSKATASQLGLALVTTPPFLVFLLWPIWCKRKLVKQSLGWCLITWTLASIKYLPYTGTTWKLQLHKMKRIHVAAGKVMRYRLIHLLL